MKDNFLFNSVVLRLQPENRWLWFEHPLKVVQVRSRADLRDALYLVDDLVDRKGLYAAGFLSYEAGAGFDRALKVKKDDFPLLWFGLYDNVRESAALARTEEDIAELNWTAELDYGQYLNNIRTIRKHIEKGDTYQVNYTFRLRSEFSLDPWTFFRVLALNHEPPYAAFVNTEDYSICSLSPELFFKLDQDILLSRPMKGTLPRKCSSMDDHLQAKILKDCAKNRAENVMITDMVRNDLGRIADPGSVKVTGLFDVEKYPTLWQMTSQVECKTNARITSILGALFPPSSITGAPKASTMNIISSLELSPRRIYTGAIGYLGPHRQGQFNVAIRTVLVDGKTSRAEYGVGGGIVWDSTPRDEWNECWTKAKSLHRRSPAFSLLETMLWTPEGGYHLLPAHLSRLESSAGYFDFTIDIDKILSSLDEFSQQLPLQCWKIRLLAGKNGWVGMEKSNLDGFDEPVSLSPALKAVDSDDPFLYHKTTHRQVYDQASPENPLASAVLLWNEKQQVTESTAANIVVEIEGGLYTPPVKCGLLAGTYRQFLLGCGMVRERVVRLDEIRACRNIFLVNSVRGFLRARMI